MYSDLMDFDIVLEKQEKGYTAYVPSLPGCISEGDTKSKTLKNINEAIGLYLEELDKNHLKKLRNAVSIERISVTSNA